VRPLLLEQVRRTCNDAISLCSNTGAMEHALRTLRPLTKATLSDTAAEAFIDGWSRHLRALAPSASYIRQARERLEMSVGEIRQALERRRGVGGLPATALPSSKTQERQRRAITTDGPPDAA
jgi:hypothetical protein